MTRGEIRAGRLRSIVDELSAIEDPHERLDEFHALSEEIRELNPVISQHRHEAAVEVIALHPEWKSKLQEIATRLVVKYSTAGEIVNRRARPKKPKP